MGGDTEIELTEILAVKNLKQAIDRDSSNHVADLIVQLNSPPNGF